MSGVRLCIPNEELGLDPGPGPTAAAVGGPCPKGNECDTTPGLFCDIQNPSGPSCTQDCFDTDCPAGSVCVDVDVDVFICLDDCSADGICEAPGAECTDFDTTRVCF